MDTIDQSQAAANIGHNGSGEITYHDFCRTGPGTIAGKYLRSFWQPIYRSQDIEKGRAKPVKIMSEDFAIYRGESGKVYVTEPRCAHRGAKLSIGWVQGEEIQCAYHGWFYSGETGQCTKQPAEPRPFCDKVKIRTFPVREYLGLVFAYLGEGTPPEFPRAPEFETDKYFAWLTTDIWPANYWAQIENAIDYAHTEFLHWHFHFKTPTKIHIEEEEYGIKVFVPGLSATADQYDTMYLTMPNTHEWAAPPGRDPQLGSFSRSWRIPLDDDHHIRFDYWMFPFGDKNDPAFVEKVKARAGMRDVGEVGKVVEKILSGGLDFKTIKENPELLPKMGFLTTVQDCAVQASLGPMATREHKEILGQTDLGIAYLRRMWKQELTAFASGKKLRDWKRPSSLWSVPGH